MSIFVVLLCSSLATSYALSTTDDLLTIEDPALFESETHSHSTRTCWSRPRTVHTDSEKLHRADCWVENTQYKVRDKCHPTLQPFGVFYCIN